MRPACKRAATASSRPAQQALQESNLQPPVLESSAPHGHADTPEHNGAQNQAPTQACLVVWCRTAQVFWTQFGPEATSMTRDRKLALRLFLVCRHRLGVAGRLG